MLTVRPQIPHVSPCCVPRSLIGCCSSKELPIHSRYVAWWMSEMLLWHISEPFVLNFETVKHTQRTGADLRVQSHTRPATHLRVLSRSTVKYVGNLIIRAKFVQCKRGTKWSPKKLQAGAWRSITGRRRSWKGGLLTRNYELWARGASLKIAARVSIQSLFSKICICWDTTDTYKYVINHFFFSVSPILPLVLFLLCV